MNQLVAAIDPLILVGLADGISGNSFNFYLMPARQCLS